MIKICITVTSHALDPLPSVTNCHTFSDPLPLERDVLYGRPLNCLKGCLTILCDIPAEYAMSRLFLNGKFMMNIKRNSFPPDSAERDSIHFDSAEGNSFPTDSAERSSFPPDSAEEMPILHRTFFPESWLWQLASVG